MPCKSTTTWRGGLEVKVVVMVQEGSGETQWRGDRARVTGNGLEVDDGGDGDGLAPFMTVHQGDD